MKLELQHGSRSRILAVIIFIITAVFIARLFHLQIIQHDHYKQLADSEQMTRLKIPAQRGLIYAMNGDEPVKLVMNETVYTVFADPAMVDEKDRVIDVMRNIAGGNLRDGFEDLLDKTDSRYQIIATKVSRVQADKIKEEKLQGIGFQAVSQRVYPEGALAGQILGFVNTEGVGNYGVEGYLDTELKGVDGRLESVTDVSDVPLTIGNRNINIPAEDGKNVVLSVDRNIQAKVEKALADGVKRTGAAKGSVIVMNPQNGQVLAMANLPTYSPAEYYKVNDAANFNNATISVPYEPASTMKTIVMSAAIDVGAMKPTDTYVNKGYIEVGDKIIHNAYKGALGTISFQTALNWSLNTGSVAAAQRLGDGKNINRQARDIMYKYYHDKFRMGEITGIELSGEAAGRIVPPTEVEGNAVRYSNMTFGQGLNVTMVQAAAAFSSIVNGGKYYKPSIINGYVDTEGNFIKKKSVPAIDQVIKPETSKQMREMTHTARGTFYSAVDKKGYYVGGKTGTSEVLVDGRYTMDQMVGSYLGYGGSHGGDDGPQYVIMVQVSGKNKALEGARDALPIFTDISNWMLDYLKLQPKG